MSANQNQPLWPRIRTLLGKRGVELSVRDSIAELVQEAADAKQAPGELPELDRQERALIANYQKLGLLNSNRLQILKPVRKLDNLIDADRARGAFDRMKSAQ